MIRAILGDWFFAAPSTADLQAELDAARAANAALVGELERACSQRDAALRREADLLAGGDINRRALIRHNAERANSLARARRALQRIADHFAEGKSGTAKLAARMAREGLE